MKGIGTDELLQNMANSIEAKKTLFAYESESSFDIYNNTIVPNITMLGYLTRFNGYLSSALQDPELSIKHLILAMNFVDRFIQNNPSFQLTDLNCHRLVCVAVLLAHKVLLDSGYKNQFFANLGGLSLWVVNQLEGDFANKMRFTFTIDPDEFAAKAISLGLHQDQVDEILATDANGMTPEESMGAIPEERLSETSNSTTPTTEYKQPQDKTTPNKIIGWMSGLCSCFGYKNPRVQDDKSQSSRSTGTSSLRSGRSDSSKKNKI